MKTVKQSKLILALILGLGSLTFAANAAYADDGGSHGNSDDSSHGNSDHGGGATSSSCTGGVVTACGVKIVKTTCTSSSSSGSDSDRHESDEHQHAEGDDRENDNYDGHGHNHADHDRDAPPAHPAAGHEHDYDFNYVDSDGVSHHVDQSQRLGTSDDGKITICHRMGGATVTLDVPDDQVNGVKAHGHGDHDMDTIGRCEDENDSDPSRDTVPRQKLSQTSTVTTSVQACLSAPAGTPMTVPLPGGGTWTGPAPGCNASGVSCNVPVAMPNRGGVRTLH